MAGIFNILPNLLTDPFMFYNQWVKEVWMTGVEDDLSPTAKALSTWSQPQLVVSLKSVSPPIQGLVTHLSVWLQATPVLTVVQHEDQLDVVNRPDEGWKSYKLSIQSLNRAVRGFVPMDVPKIQISKLWYFPYWRALSIKSFSVSLGTISSSFPDFISLKLFWCDEMIQSN